MTTDNPTGVGETFDQSLMNPATWKEPKETIPVKVVKSEYRYSDPKYNKPTDFRPAFPHTGKGPEGNSIPQWDLQLERQDAKYALLDGTEAPVIIYGGVDLLKYSKNRAGEYELQGIMKGRSKENMIITAWTKLVGSIHSDPGKIVGLYFEVEMFRQKELGPGFFAKNVCLPVKPLPPTYAFTGEVRVFQQTARVDEAAAASGEATTSAAGFGGSVVSVEDAATKIGAFIRDNGFGDDALNTTLVTKPGFPDGCRIDPFMTALARGTLRDTLAGFGVEI